MIDRKLLLQKLLRFDGSLAAILQPLRTFGWDSNGSLVTLRRADIIAVLKRYIQSKLTASDVEQWANAIEGREDISYETGHAEVIQAAIHELANPILTQPLSVRSAQGLLLELHK